MEHQLSERVSKLVESGIDTPTADALKAYVAGKDTNRLQDADPDAIKAIMFELQSKMGIKYENVDLQMLDSVTGTLMTMFGKLTISDLRNAVEAWFSGRLVDGRGNLLEPANHYQNFSVAFVAQWLNAYKRYKLESVTKIARLLPPPEEAPKTNFDRIRAELEFRIQVERFFREWYEAEYAASDENPDQVFARYEHLAAETYMIFQNLEIYVVSDEWKRKYLEDAERVMESRAKEDIIQRLKKFGKMVVETVLVERSPASISLAKSMCCKRAFERCKYDPDAVSNILGLAQCFWPNGIFDPSPTVENYLSQPDDGKPAGEIEFAHVYHRMKSRTV